MMRGRVRSDATESTSQDIQATNTTKEEAVRGSSSSKLCVQRRHTGLHITASVRRAYADLVLMTLTGAQVSNRTRANCASKKTATQTGEGEASKNH